MVFAVRIHGRGGQGVVTAAELLSVAAFEQGRHSLAFPSFGSERSGAPVVAFCRIDDHEIRSHEPIAEPDALIVQDATLLHQVDVFSGLRPDGYVLINSTLSFAELGLEELAAGLHPERHLVVPATALAKEHIGRPIPNAVLLGGFAGMSGLISLESLAAAIREKFPERVAGRNIAAAEAAFAFVGEEVRELARA